TIAENVKSGITIDQVIANKIGQDSPLPSLELATEDFTGWIGGCDTAYSCAYMNTISWKNETTPPPIEINPPNAVERLVGPAGTRARRGSGRRACATTRAFSTRSARKHVICRRRSAARISRA